MEINKEKQMNVLQQAAEEISSAKNIIITAGAGMGVDSGLPDFRGDNGFWRAYPPLQGIPFVEMANPQKFEENVRLAWGFYGHRLDLYRETVPHNGFSILQKWVKNRPFFIYTSNVDGQFQKAGFLDQRIIEIHGSIHHLQYFSGGNSVWSAEDLEVEIQEENLHFVGEIPMDDGRLLRPNILMFGDYEWESSRTDAQYKVVNTYIKEHFSDDTSKTVIIEMGAGTGIPSIRNFGERRQRNGEVLIRINPRESKGPAGTISIPMGAKAALEGIDEIIMQQQ
jgi:NAD-dependent SIR2 family protein deacetylase